MQHSLHLVARKLAVITIAFPLTKTNILTARSDGSSTGRPESQQPTESQVIRIFCRAIYGNIDKTVKMHINSY